MRSHLDLSYLTFKWARPLHREIYTYTAVCKFFLNKTLDAYTHTHFDLKNKSIFSIIKVNLEGTTYLND